MSEDSQRPFSLRPKAESKDSVVDGSAVPLKPSKPVEAPQEQSPGLPEERMVHHSQGSNSSFVVEGISLGSRPPIDPVVIRDENAATPDKEAPADELGTIPVEGGVAAVGSDAEAEEVAPKKPLPYVRRRSSGGGALGAVFIRLFILFAKGFPVLIVLGGGYYAYSYYFGPVSAVDVIVQKGAAALGIDWAPAKHGPSKAAQILKQTRDVVNASDSRVNFANALADQNPSSTNLNDPMPKAPVAATTAVANENSPAPTRSSDALSLDAAEKLAAKLSGISISPGLTEEPAYSIYAPTTEAESTPVEVETTVEPTSEFRAWVDKATISGVRAGVHPIVIVNNLAMSLGEIVYHPLKVTIYQVDADAATVIFKDKTGATLGKRY